MVSYWYLYLVKQIENQEGFLDGDCVGYLLGVVLGVSVGHSVGKPDSGKLCC